MIERKFEEVYNVEDYEILTDCGWEDVKKIGKTIPYNVWQLTLDGFSLECADTHIVFTEDYQEVFVKDLKVDDLVQTLEGPKKVLEVLDTGVEENMYDVELQEGNRRYFTDGILSHNTLWLCHSASALVKNGYNIAYYTAEMAEEAITKRIDANVLNLQMKQLSMGLEKDYYLSHVNKNYIELPQRGRLFVKEYPTGFGTRDNILQNLNDLKIKEGFIPDAIIIDSVNIFASSRLPASLLGNTYVYQKAVAEEFRAIGVEKDIAVVSATQLNRESSNKSAEAMDTTGTSDCVALNTLVKLKNGETKRIDELKVGEEIKGSNGFVKVAKIWPKKKKRKYRIITKSGKVLECSIDHKIMTETGLKSLKEGLTIGDRISSINK